MVKVGTSNCPKCDSELRYYDRVKRIVRTKNGVKKYVYVRRLKCVNCKSVHREIPEFIFPYKHYESDIIEGVLDGFITIYTIGFEERPCEETMQRWICDIYTGFYEKDYIRRRYYD